MTNYIIASNGCIICVCRADNKADAIAKCADQIKREVGLDGYELGLTAYKLDEYLDGDDDVVVLQKIIT